MSENALKLWKAWKQFPDWYNKYWKYVDRRKTIKDKTWTDGVITAFIVTSIEPSFKGHVHLERDGRIDYTLFKGNRRFAHMEHENNIKNVESELLKLTDSDVKLKVIVSYGTSMEIDYYLKSFMHKIDDPKRINRFDEEWLFIFGINSEAGYFENLKNWKGYSIAWKEKRIREKKLQW